MKIEVKTSVRKTKHADRFGVLGDRLVPCVDVIIDGISFMHDCENPEEARALAIRISYAMGLV